jgi:hypothetical protein
MRRIIPLLLAVALAAFVSCQIDNAGAQGLTGNDFLRMGEKYQSFYVLGFWDGAMVCCEYEEANNNKSNFRNLMKVMDGMEHNQLIDLVKKYLKDNPDKRHKPIGFLLYKCIEEAAK